MLGPQGGPDARPQLESIEGLGYAVDRSQIQSPDPIVAAARAGQEDHRDRTGGRVFLQAPAHLEAVHLGHVHIEQDQVRVLAAGGFQPFFAVAGA
jgi:hypothetical protein